jgi:hypothetical protein
MPVTTRRRTSTPFVSIRVSFRSSVGSRTLLRIRRNARRAEVPGTDYERSYRKTETHDNGNGVWDVTETPLSNCSTVVIPAHTMRQQASRSAEWGAIVTLRITLEEN